MNKIVTSDEIKAITGLGSGDDAKIEIYNRTNVEILATILGLQDFATHTVTNERVCINDQYYMLLRDFPVDLGSIVLKTPLQYNPITGYSYRQDERNIRRINFFDSGDSYPYALGYEEVVATYSAGYTLRSTMQVTDISGLAGLKFDVLYAGIITEYEFVAGAPSGNQIQVGANVDDTAANIAAALGGSASTSTATLGLGYSIDDDSEILTKIVSVNATIPWDLKVACALMVQGSIASSQNVAGVESYTVGSKTISFKNDADKVRFQNTLEPYLAKYKRIKIIA